MAMPALPTIVFHGTRLPAYASVVDVAAACLEVGEETALWFWRFTICTGVTRSAPSTDVLRHAVRLRAALRRHADDLRPELARRLPSADPARVLADWDRALDIIARAAGTSPECTWRGEAL